MHGLIHSREFLSALVGAVVGAVAGGTIAWLLQLQSLREARKERAGDRRVSQQALANSLFFKLVRIYSDFVLIQNHVEQGCGGVPEDQLWQALIPLGNLPPHIHFSADEMGMLLSLKDNKVFNDVLPLDGVHNSLSEIATLYRDRREALGQQMPIQAAEGNVLSSFLTKEQALALAPQIASLNSIVEQMRGFAAKDVTDSRGAMEGLQALLQTKLGMTIKFVCLDAPPSEALTSEKLASEFD